MQIGNTINTPVEKAIDKLIWDKVYYQLKNIVENSLRGAVWESVWDKLNFSLTHPLVLNNEYENR
jgi:hypothetical protein